MNRQPNVCMFVVQRSPDATRIAVDRQNRVRPDIEPIELPFGCGLGWAEGSIRIRQVAPLYTILIAFTNVPNDTQTLT